MFLCLFSMWVKYKKEHSGIDYYKIGEDFIEIRFKTRAEPYLYNYSVTGKVNVEKMKRLARANKGLSTYISVYIKDRYVKAG